MPTRISKRRFDELTFGLRGSGSRDGWVDVAHWETDDGHTLSALFYVEEVDAFLGGLFVRDEAKRFKTFGPLVPFFTKRSG